MHTALPNGAIPRDALAGVPESMGSAPASPHAATARSSSSGKSTGAKEACAPHAARIRQCAAPQRRELYDTTKTRGEPGRAKQIHAPCVSSIPIPPSSRYSGRLFPHMQRFPAAPDKKKEQRKTGNAPFPAPPPSPRPILLPHVVLGPPSLAIIPLPLLLAISSRPCPSVPVVCSIGSSIRNPDPRHHNPASTNAYLPIALELPHLVATASGPVAGMHTLGTSPLVLPARRTAPILEALGGTCGAVWRYCALVEGVRSAHGTENSGRALVVGMRMAVVGLVVAAGVPIAALELPQVVVAAGGAVVVARRLVPWCSCSPARHTVPAAPTLGYTTWRAAAVSRYCRYAATCVSFFPTAGADECRGQA
ncbi:hypothetical protein B0H13DRAFT_2419999 [Mycena leptocephala]|nr:hypothetical protein B0H13DRAFT_2419999 [Mycena leptocephala]